MKYLTISPKKVIRKLLIAGVLEFGPVFVFLLSFEYLHIYKATIILMITTIFSTVATYRIQKRLPYLALYVALLTSIFGYITLSHHQPRFIQMRDTLYDATCAVTLMVGLIFNISFLKFAFHSVIPMAMKSWNVLTYCWIVFFVSAAFLNEYVRTHFTLGQWFDFKSIMVMVTLTFGLLSLYFVYENEDTK